MKILIYAPIFPPTVGGPATQGYHLCRVLKKRGHTPVVFTIGKKFEVESPDGYLVYRYPWNYTNTPLDKILRFVVFPFYFSWILFKEKPDILHSNNVSTLSLLGGWIAKAFRTPSIVKYGGEWVWETLSALKLRNANLDELHSESFIARFLWKVEKVGLNGYNCIWVPSEYRGTSVAKITGRKDNIFVIFNSMDLPEGGFHDLTPEDPFIVVSASRFIPHKRLPLIIKAFKEMGDPNSKLVLIGEGEETENAKKAAVEYGVERQVEFTGRLFGQPIYDEFAKASVYVSASLEEGFPNVFVEAIHFGLPIISSDVGGCKEMVKDDFNGYLFQPFDEQELINKLKKLNSDRILRNKMAKNSYEFSLNFDLNVTIDKFIDMYETAVKNFNKK